MKFFSCSPRGIFNKGFKIPVMNGIDNDYPFYELTVDDALPNFSEVLFEANSVL